MLVFKVINIEDDTEVARGYAEQITVDGRLLSNGVVRTYSKKGNIYHNKYKIIRVGDDGKRSNVYQKRGAFSNDKKYVYKKKDVNKGLEKDLEEANKLGLSWGKYQAYKEGIIIY